MKTLTPAVFFIAAILITLVSCKKADTTSDYQPTSEFSTTNQLSVADEQVYEGINTAMDAADGTEDGNADMRPLACAMVTVNVAMKMITVDFGTGCTNPITGETRSGKIIVGYTGDSYITATQRTFRFENFRTIDTVSLYGTFTQSNIVHASNTVAFTLSASDFTFLLGNGQTHTIVTYERNFIIDLGSNLRDFSDNTTTVSGNTTGINKEGEAYSVAIITPVVFKGECEAGRIFYPAAGTCDIKIGNKPKFNLSWGNGACDKIITITYFGNSFDIALQ